VTDYLELYSMFLSAVPGSVEGAGRTLDLWATMDDYNQSRTPEEADLIATAMDWMAVGDDLTAGLEEVASELPYTNTEVTSRR
jgi:hypothetical protein